jgi:hypothetical protein
MYFYFLLAVYAIRGYRGRINKFIKKQLHFSFSPKILAMNPRFTFHCLVAVSQQQRHESEVPGGCPPRNPRTPSMLVKEVLLTKFKSGI